MAFAERHPRTPALGTGLIGAGLPIVAFLFATGAVFVALRMFKGPMLMGGLVLIAVMAVLWTRPERATQAGIFALYLNLGGLLVSYHNEESLLVSMMTFALLALPFGVALLHLWFAEHKGILADSTLGYMLLYWSALALSAVMSNDPGNSVRKLTTYTLEGVVLYFLVVNVVRSGDVLRKCLWALVLSGALLGALSTVQVATKSYNNTFGGLAKVQRVELEGNTESASKLDHPRVAGSLGETNRYGQLMVVLLPIALFLAKSESVPALKWIAAFSCLPILAGVLLTGSRGAAVTVLLVVLSVAALGHLRWTHIAGVAAAGVLLAAILVPQFAQRLSTLSALTEVPKGRATSMDSSLRQRATIVLATARIFRDNPVFGVGPGQARLYVERYSEGGLTRITRTRRGHNLYLEELANTGLVGFSFFALVVASVVRRLVRLRRSLLHVDSQAAYLATALLMAIVAYLISAMFLHLSYERYFWVLIALGSAATMVLRGEERTLQVAPLQEPYVSYVPR